MKDASANRSRGFTLLELLASVTLLVVLGALLFEVFSRAAEVIRSENGRLEVYQYARAIFWTMDRELTGAIGDREAAPCVEGTPFRVFTTPSGPQEAGQEGNMEMREGTDAVTLTSALVGRDTMKDSPTFGQTANAAFVAYWVSPETCALNRYESYDLAKPIEGREWEFASNVLEFKIDCLDADTTPVEFRNMDWDSKDLVEGVQRGLPRAVKVTLRITDTRHVGMYEFDGAEKKMTLKEGLIAEDDPICDEFSGIIRIR